MLRLIKRIYNFILSNEHPVADMLWQLDNDLDTLNAMIIEATKEISK